MIEIAMIESVVKVLGTFTEILKYRQVKRKEFFLNVIEPLFGDLMEMHADYMKMFDECWSQLLDNKVPLEEIARSLRLRRIVYEGLRIKARAVTDALNKSDLDPEIKTFLTAASYHIPDGELGPVMSTPSGMVLSKLYSAAGSRGPLVDVPHENGTSPRGDRKEVLDLVIETSNDIRKRWAWICEEYVRVKVWSLK
jgi:hypothetical protein